MTDMSTNPSDGSSTMNDLELTYDLDWRDYLRGFVDELERRKAALPTRQNIAQWTRGDFYRDIAECHHALGDVLRCVIEINTSHCVPPNLRIDVESVLYQCIGVHLFIDRVTTQLFPLVGGTLPSSWAEL
jgi:hypothetical protein